MLVEEARISRVAAGPPAGLVEVAILGTGARWRPAEAASWPSKDRARGSEAEADRLGQHGAAQGHQGHPARARTRARARARTHARNPVHDNASYAARAAHSEAETDWYSFSFLRVFCTCTCRLFCATSSS